MQITFRDTDAAGDVSHGALTSRQHQTHSFALELFGVSISLLGHVDLRALSRHWLSTKSGQVHIQAWIAGGRHRHDVTKRCCVLAIARSLVSPRNVQRRPKAALELEYCNFPFSCTLEALLEFSTAGCSYVEYAMSNFIQDVVTDRTANDETIWLRLLAASTDHDSARATRRSA
jgi:hypothetical protein